MKRRRRRKTCTVNSVSSKNRFYFAMYIEAFQHNTYIPRSIPTYSTFNVGSVSAQSVNPMDRAPETLSKST